MDDEADEMDGDDLDGRADMADEVHADVSDGEIDEDMDFGVGGGIQYDMAKQMEADMAANAIIHSGITTEKWQIEVERVTHKLKINKNLQDENAWRSHLDQTKKYADQVKAALPDFIADNIDYEMAERLRDGHNANEDGPDGTDIGKVEDLPWEDLADHIIAIEAVHRAKKSYATDSKEIIFAYNDAFNAWL